MDDELRNWEPTDGDLADLQCLARRFGELTGVHLVELAKAAASGVIEGPDSAMFSDDAKKNIADDFRNFMGRWNAKLVTRIRPHACFLVDAILQHARVRPRDRVVGQCAELCALLTHHRNFRELTAVSDFMAIRDRYRSTELGAAEQETRTENNLFVAFNQLANDFNEYSHDAHFRHDRLKAAPAPDGRRGNGADGSPVDGQFVLIRRSSRAPDSFVAHAMFIGIHTDDDRVLYFSEQLRALEDEIETNRRMTQGICIFDGQHMTAIARPRFNTYFTYISARIDDIDAPLDWFRALIMTTNRNGERIAAEALCLRCASRADRERKVGLHAVNELQRLFDGPQRTALDDWLAGSPAPPIVL